jgi:type II secretory pathway pseudopilin PulG
MELVVTVAIIGTLAVFAVPAYLEAQQNGKANKAQEVMSTIGSAVVNKYTSIAHYGFQGSAISQLEATGDGTWLDLSPTTVLMRYEISGTPQVVTLQNLFKDGVPKSPFGAGWQIQIPDSSKGAATWVGDPPQLIISSNPAFMIRDANQIEVSAVYTL